MLELVNVEMVYSRLILALKGVSLEVPDGAIVALLGANGAVKTTTLKSISGLQRAEEGEVTRGHIYRRKHENWTARQFAASWRRSTREGLKHQKRYGKDPYMLVRYEDFTSAPEEMVQRLCDFMGISTDESMLTPTRSGKSWQGNSMFSEKFESISSAPVGRWKNSLSLEELVTLETIDHPQMEALQYARSDSKLGDLPFASRLKVIQNSILITLKETVYG